MDKYLYLNSLYDIYKELLTEKQQMYFENYYFDNLSLAEIANNLNISRNAVHNQLKIIEDKLTEFEEKLKIKEKEEKIIKMLYNKIDDKTLEEIKRII